MKAEESAFDDPVVREVRAAREKLWKEGGGTIQGFRRVVRKRAAKLKPRAKTSKKKFKLRS